MSPPTTTDTLDITTLPPLLRTPTTLSHRSHLLPLLSTNPLFAPTPPGLSAHDKLLHTLHLLTSLLHLHLPPAVFTTALSLLPPTPLHLHHSAFTRPISLLATPRQKSHWLPLCTAHEVIGCYAQTELAHGSDVAALQTTATLDVDGDEWVLDTPGVGGRKWWIGGAGVVATHALVAAQLLLPGGVTGGVGLVIVRIRDEEHRLVPGVRAGGIGPKAYGGFGGVDNGWLHFTGVRTPRVNLLGERVDAAGRLRPALRHEGYAGMTALRAGIPGSQGWALAKAVTIAVRYCSRRTQFHDTPVLRYESTRMRLVPLLVKALAFIIAGAALTKAATESTGGAGAAELHLLASAMKVAVTTQVAAGIEEARRAMGGHGFSDLAGVGRLFADTTPAQTFEGDNWVLAQQSARGLRKMRSAAAAAAGGDGAGLPESCRYLAQDSAAGEVPETWDSADPVQILSARARALVAALPAEGDVSWPSMRIANAHADVFIATTLATTPGVPEVVRKVWALTALEAATADLTEVGIGTKGLRAAWEREVLGVVEEVMQGLVGGFGFWDWELPGVLGREKVKEGGEEGALWRGVEKMEEVDRKGQEEGGKEGAEGREGRMSKEEELRRAAMGMLAAARGGKAAWEAKL
ncbi:hypothetical protein EDC01DRAFT_615533 [Geopyxis carbonaria]|nr:hypothetical protein EDC01DRAFT_615533 [Geopyxis carbonaria]